MRVLCLFWNLKGVMAILPNRSDPEGVYTKLSGRFSKEPFSWLIQKFPRYWYLKLDNHVVNSFSTCLKDKLGWIWRADDPLCRTLSDNIITHSHEIVIDSTSRFILCMRPTNQRRRCNVTVVSHWLGAYTKWSKHNRYGQRRRCRDWRPAMICMSVGCSHQFWWSHIAKIWDQM